MASLQKRLSSNVAGNFFVDATCIDCGTCRGLAPQTFADQAGTAYVYRQPDTEAQKHCARMAVLACPVGAIGTVHQHSYTAAQAAFPEPIAGNVYHCGYTSAQSYGASSYFIRRPQGNLLIDSPRFTAPLVRRLEAWGGVQWLFLTHADDVAEQQRFQAHFGCQRMLHKADITATTQAVELQPEGTDVIALDQEVHLIPVPGHTAGSLGLLSQETFLFSGDHLWWDPQQQQRIRASPGRTAGTTGLSRLLPRNGSYATALNGCCRATASAATSPRRAWRRKYAGVPSG